MPTYKLTIEYEGTRYSGWQAQSNTPKTVQGRLINAAGEAFGECDLGGAGRTDAGVHASGQVAHLRIRRKARPLDIQREINDRLPADIHVLLVEETHDRFHARHDAESRVYLYQIARRRTAFAKPFVWWIRDRLDVEPMQAAASTLVGMHDFANFSDRRITAESTKVLVQSISVEEEGDLILIRLAASHFLWKMVRKIVAVLADVGRGSRRPEEMRALLEGDRAVEPTAPPSGLFLEQIVYPGEVFDRPLTAIVPVSTWIPTRNEKTWGKRKKS
jgi:tRNA pseudouridine38-40 synthase